VNNNFTQGVLIMAKQWIQGAIKHPGALRKTMGVKTGEKIPENKLEAVAEQKGVTGQRARLAMTLKKMHK
jgi:hypothetical protein